MWNSADVDRRTWRSTLSGVERVLKMNSDSGSVWLRSNATDRLCARL
jgi:hypothetical protein